MPQGKPVEMPEVLSGTETKPELEPWMISPEEPGVPEGEALYEQFKEAFGPYQPPTIESTQEIAIEEETEEVKAQTGGGLSNLSSPEGILMMGVAITLDLVGLVINLCALDDLGMLDIFGIIIICGWMLFRSQGKRVTASAKAQQKAQKWLTKLFRGKWSKFLTPIIGEIIPYVGALPCWTLAVFFEVTEIEVPVLAPSAKKEGSPKPIVNA
jgi:hypothetical protein